MESGAATTTLTTLTKAEEVSVNQQIQLLQSNLSKKQKFEDSVSQIKSLLLSHYPSASPSLRQSFYSAVCRVATILRTRYTAPGFWQAGLGLFREAEPLMAKDSVDKRESFKGFIAQAKQHLDLSKDPTPPAPSASSSSGGYLFEGHLTVDPEPPQPRWLVQSNLMNAILAGNDNSIERFSNLLEESIGDLDSMMLEMVDNIPRVPKVPPASKDAVAKLPIVTVTKDILAKMGEDAECAICKENLVDGDKMQELPCKHTFHPPCLKPWLDEHNSCPICRHELQTDDHVYESWKEREKEAEEERKGAANALPGGEYMIV